MELTATPINIATNKHQNHRDKFEQTSYFRKMVKVIQRFPAHVLYPGAAEQQQSILTYQRYSDNLEDGSNSKTQTTPYSNQHSASSTATYSDDNGDSHHRGGRVITSGLPHTVKKRKFLPW